MADANGPRLKPQGSPFSAVSGLVMVPLLIGAVGALLVLWRDVAIIQRRMEVIVAENTAQMALNAEFAITKERLQATTALLARFKTSYDRQESVTADQLTKQWQLITDVQQHLKVLQEHVTNLERGAAGR